MLVFEILCVFFVIVFYEYFSFYGFCAGW